MSFGFSVSDIYGCAHLAYMLYDEFKQAAGVCQEFSRGLLLFHQVLSKVKSTIESEPSHLSQSDQAALGACLDSCKELLYVQILGAAMVPKDLNFESYTHELQIIFPISKNSDESSYDQISLSRGLRQKLRER